MSVSAATKGSIVPSTRLRGQLRMPADKSVAHRALLLGALSGGPSVVTLRAPGQDVLSTIGCLRALGVDVEQAGDRWTVSHRPSRDADLDCGNSGTTMRLLAGALAGLPLRVTLDGDASLRSRPMERVASVLQAAGADVTTSDGHAPLTVTGRPRLRAATHRLPVASAQLVGAAALAGLAAEGETRIETPGPTRDHTERLLGWLGVPIRREGRTTTLRGPAAVRPFDLTVPGDPSAAAAWLVAGALHRDGDVTIAGIGLNPTRLAIVRILRRMGADVDVRVTDETGPEPVGALRVRGGRPLTGVRIEGPETAELIDELPLVAVAMATADGVSEVRDAAELRVKESDRIARTVAGLRAIGANAEELAHGWRVRRGEPRVGRVVTGGDHRIAIAFAVAAASGVAAAVELDEPACVAVSYPGFFKDLEAVTG